MRHALNKQNKVRRVKLILLKDCTSRSTSRVEYTNNVRPVESIVEGRSRRPLACSTLHVETLKRSTSREKENFVETQYVALAQ